MKKSGSAVVSVLCASLASWAVASQTVVDRHARRDFGTVAVASDDMFFIDSGAGSVTKSGTGDWTLPLGNFFAFGSGFEFGLLGGGLNLTAGTAPDYVATPPAALNDAAVWLVAGRNFATNAAGNVTAWYDARESSAAAVQYGYAEAPAEVLAGTKEGVVSAAKNNRPAIAFRAFLTGSGKTERSLELRTVAGNAATYNMYDGFYVISPRGRQASENQHAPILGNTANGYFFSGSKGTGAMLSEDGNAEWKAYACTYRHNGVEEDPTAPIDGNACHVCSFSAYNTLTIPINSLVRDRNLGSGGVYLHEVLIFTRRLTPAERAQVTAYLMQRWQVEAGVMTVNGIEGTVVKVPDVSMDKVNISGGAAFGPAGDSFTPSMHYAAREFAKRYRLEAGGGHLNAQGTEYALRLADGDNITIDDTQSTNRLVRNSAGTAGRISISGARRATVIDQVPATKLTVSSTSGDIVLRGRSKVDTPYLATGSAPATLSATSLSVPAGTGGATVSVTIPTTGDWEVEFDIRNAALFKTGGSWTTGAAVSYKVFLDGHVDKLDKIALTVNPSEIGNVVPHRRYLIRGLEAGSYTLKIAGLSAGVVAASVSNLAFTFVPNPERETIVPVTEGDFESMSMNKPYFSSRDNLGSGAYTQWQIANGTGIAANPIVQSVVNSMMGVAVTSGGYDFQFRAHELGRYGDNALMWIHTNSTASTIRNTAVSPATVLPAGTWKLRMKACRMTTGPTSFSSKVGTNPADSTQRCGKALARYQAMVKVNGGSPVDLGVTDEVDSFVGKTYCYPNAFTVAEGDSVVVVLDQLVGWSFSLTDDYEFVKVEENPVEPAGLGPELIVDGSFESDGTGGTKNWTRDSYTDDSAQRVDVISVHQNTYGKTACDGDYVARSFSGARYYQPVALEKGVYRLSYWSRARCDSVYGNGLPGYACRLHFWYASEGSATTNRIVSGDTLWCTNFYETTALFEVKAAGTYVVGFNADPRIGGVANDSLTDCVSVRKVLDMTSVPEVASTAELGLDPGNGQIRLDYPGTLDVRVLRMKGRRYFGEVSAETYPECVAGPGTIRVTGPPEGAVLIVR